MLATGDRLLAWGKANDGNITIGHQRRLGRTRVLSAVLGSSAQHDAWIHKPSL